MHARARRPAPGHTLLELLIALAVAATLGALALPALGTMLAGARQRTRTTAFVVSVQLARGAALTREAAVVLCPSDDGAACGEDFAAGWIVFEDRDGDRLRQDDEELIDAYAAPRGGTVRSGRPRFVWHPRGRRSTNGTVTFCHPQDPRLTRAVVVSYTGRPRATDRLPGGAKPPC